MGDLGYIVGFCMAFVACLGCLVGFVIGRWMK